MTSIATRALGWIEQGYFPDSLVRWGIRRLLTQRASSLRTHSPLELTRNKSQFVTAMNDSPIALMTASANKQHYEVPTQFFTQVLGKHAKYSCAYWTDKVANLDEAEQEALKRTCINAELTDGMDILELGCGWGSLTLWIAKHYPNSQITAVSNSRTQRSHILGKAQQLNLTNIHVLHCDMTNFSSQKKFDRIVSVEMFEHMRNYQELFRRVSNWLKPDGKFLLHIFCHKEHPYLFEDITDSDWMTRHFFSGGMMPCDDLPLHFQDQLLCTQQWRWNGSHYSKTAEAWLQRMDENKASLWPLFEQTYGVRQAQQWWMRWRMFFMACAELFAYDGGRCWWVSHYLFRVRS